MIILVSIFIVIASFNPVEAFWGCRQTAFTHSHNTGAFLSIPNLRGNLSGAKRSDQWVSKAVYEGFSKIICSNVRPGIQHLNHGINKYWFSMNDTDQSPAVGNLFDYNCTFPRNDDEFNLPLQIHSIQKYSRAVLTESISSFSNLGEIMASTSDDIMDFWFMYVKQKSSIHLQLEDTESNTTIISYVVARYKVLLYGNVEPSSNLKTAYFDLPVEYNNNEVQFHRILVMFGSHFYKDASLGARLFLVLKHRYGDKLDLTEIKKNDKINPHSLGQIITDYAKSSNASISSKFILTKGGTLPVNASLDVFVESVDTSPVPIAGTLLELPYLIDPSPDTSPRAKAFKDAIGSERNHHLLKRYLLQVRDGQQDGFYRNFLMATLRTEIEFIRPSTKMINILNDAAKNSLKYDSYFLNCIHKGWSDENCVTQVHNDRYFILQGICVSVWTGKFPNCQRIEWSLPNSCIRMYEEAGCTGWYQTVEEPHDAPAIFVKSRSFMLC